MIIKNEQDFVLNEQDSQELEETGYVITDDGYCFAEHNDCVKVFRELDEYSTIYSNGTGLMSFSSALKLLKQGKKVARKGWNGKGLWLELQRPDAHSKMTLPYIYLNYPKGDKYHDACRVPWFASQTDMLEEDWMEVKENVL